MKCLPDLVSLKVTLGPPTLDELLDYWVLQLGR